MKRLKNPKKVLFFNSVATTDFGIYNDKDGYAVLNIKKEGVSLKAPNAMEVDPAGALTAGLKLTASYTDDGIYQSCLLKLNAPAAAEDIYYDYSLSIRKIVKTPGVNTFQNNTYTKTYGGTLDAVATSGGYVTDAYKLIMENKLLDMITNDTYMHSNNSNLVTNFAGSTVEARRIYHITGIGATDDQDLSVFDPNGTLLVTVSNFGSDTLGAGASVSLETMIDALNADATFATYCLALAESTTSCYILFKTAGYKGTITIDDGTDNTMTIDYRGIHLVSKDTEVQFTTEFETPNFFTRYNFGIIRATWVHSHNSYWRINNGASETIAVGANVDTFRSNINAATFDSTLAHYYISCAEPTTGAGWVDIVIKPTVDQIGWKQASMDNVTGGITNGFTISTTNYLRSSPSGRFPSLTSDDVARAVMGLQHLGDIPFQYKSQPTNGSAYAKYSMVCNTTINDDFGVSQLATYEQEVDLYVLKSAAQTAVWDATDGYYSDTNSGAADTTLEALLSIWAGVVETNWLPDIAVTT